MWVVRPLRSRRTNFLFAAEARLHQGRPRYPRGGANDAEWHADLHQECSHGSSRPWNGGLQSAPHAGYGRRLERGSFLPGTQRTGEAKNPGQRQAVRRPGF